MKTLPVIIDETAVQPKKLNIMFHEGNLDIQPSHTYTNPESSDTGRFGYIVINTGQTDMNGNLVYQNNGQYAAIPVMFLQSLPESVTLRPAATNTMSQKDSAVPSRQFVPAYERGNDYSDSISLQLSRRERQILNYVAQGYLNKQIADILSISEQTIKNHVTSILRKLNASGRTQAVINAIKLGLIDVPETAQ